jgi:hypothetical protein
VISLRRRISLGLLAAVLGAVLGAGLLAAEQRPLEPRDLALVWKSPVNGQQAAAGSLLEISWDADPRALAGRDIEEWEAFLSLDGGRSYRLRLTPHLDVKSRSYSWRIPADLTGEARLLLRVGDERDEYSHEPGILFAILPATEAHGAVELEESAAELGESARPGEVGVLAWEDGGRDGSRLRRRVARRPLEPFTSAAHSATLITTFHAPPPSATELRPPVATALRLDLSPPAGPRAERPPPAVPIRLLIHRFNE